MRIAAMADLHGRLNHSVPECDVLILAGDIMPLYSSAEDWHSRQELEWVKTKFTRWLRRQIREKQSIKRVFVAAGNHDICFYDSETFEEAWSSIYDIDDTVVRPAFPSSRESHICYHFERCKFTFYPWTPTIQDRTWAYSASRKSQVAKLACSLIPSDTDVLVTHGPPQGLLDTNLDGDRTGCAALMYRMLEIGPALTICGHIHEQRGKRAWYYDLQGNERRIANVSICDANYSERGAKVQTFDI